MTLRPPKPSPKPEPPATEPVPEEVAEEVAFLDRLVDYPGMPNEVVTFIWERKQKVLGLTPAESEA